MLHPFLRATYKSDAFEIVDTTTATGTSTSFVINKPSGTANGDLLVAVMFSSGSGAQTWTGATGWTEAIDQNTAPNLRIAYKTAGSSEGSSYTFTATGGTAFSGAMICIRNGVWDTVGTITTTTGGAGNVNMTAPAITIGANDSFLFAVFGIGNSRTWTTSASGLVALVNNTTAPSFQIFYDDLVAAGANTTKTATGSSTLSGGAAVQFSVKPA